MRTLISTAWLSLALLLAAGAGAAPPPERRPQVERIHVVRAAAPAPAGRGPGPEVFALEGKAIILDEGDLGIINGLLTTNVPYREVLACRGLYAPPYASSDFLLEVRICGERVPTRRYRWQPFAVERQGRVQGVAVSSSLVLAAGRRAVILAMTLGNPARQARRLPVQVAVRGGLEQVRSWEFGRPNATRETALASAGQVLTRHNEAGAIVVASDLPGLRWEGYSGQWETAVTLRAGERRTHYLCVGLGEPETAARDCAQVLADPRRALAEARQQWAARVADLFARLPRLEAEPRLERYYYRSLLHLLLNRWQVPEFMLHPCYTTGSINGGCVCCYLWDFGEAWEVLPLYDPAACREHIKQFLRMDLTAHFAFSPLTGEPFGPWYPVNQEKIIRSIYYYVLESGDSAFLQEEVAGKSILDWALHQALVGDDPARPVALIDYGDGNHHLELRGKERYDYVLPDLNGRRYDNYLAAYHLARLAGREAQYLQERAAALKRLLREQMWSPAEGWFHHLDPQGGKHLRYTMQMFKLVGSEVLDGDQEQGLLSHLNEQEFLSAWGMHSMSKLDAAYDQGDIDNGGGGSYVSFPPQIAERLYRAGRPELAADILGRLLWLGERLPYWGDSQVANCMDYRRDTPLQCSIGGAAGAQCVIFGMFGVGVRPNGDIVVNPRLPAFSPQATLAGLRLRGCCLDIAAGPREYQVRANGQVIRSPVGRPVVIRVGPGL